MTDKKLPDYKTLIDDETWAFIELTESFYPPETIDYSIVRQREIYNAMCRQFHNGYPASVSAIDSTIKHEHHAVPVRRYTNAAGSNSAHIMYFHGGGFVVGGLDSHDDVCAELCDRTGFGVTSVDYRLAPEHRHPAAFDDSLACTLHESDRLQIPLLLCGDSAGGNLATAVSHVVRDKQLKSNLPAIAGQVLIYPGLGGDVSSGSYVTHAEAPMLTTRDVRFYADIRSSRINRNSTDATLAPLTDTNFAGLPNTVIVSAECDPLSDDGRHYRDAIVRAGGAAGGNAVTGEVAGAEEVAVEMDGGEVVGSNTYSSNTYSGKAAWFNETGLVHGYLRARRSVTRAENSFSRIVSALEMLAKGEWYE